MSQLLTSILLLLCMFKTVHNVWTLCHVLILMFYIAYNLVFYLSMIEIVIPVIIPRPGNQSFADRYRAKHQIWVALA